MYKNQGIVCGVLASRPMKVNDKIVLIRVRTVERNIDKKTGKKEVNVVSVYAYGSYAERIVNAKLQRGQEIDVEYKIRSQVKVIDGQEKDFEDKVLTDVRFGRKPEVQKKPSVVANVEDEIIEDEVVEEVVEEGEHELNSFLDNLHSAQGFVEEKVEDVQPKVEVKEEKVEPKVEHKVVSKNASKLDEILRKG